VTWLYFLAFGFACFWLGVAVGHHGAIVSSAKDVCPFKSDEGTARMMERLREHQQRKILH
jgi:hypothetical protein